MNKLKPSISLICLLAVGCAITPEAKLANAQRKIAKAPFDDRPILFEVYEKNGTITSTVKQAWLKEWNEVKEKREADRIAAEKVIEKQRLEQEKEQRRIAAERKRMWDSLTPAQKMDFEMRSRQMALQQDLANQQEEAQRRAMIGNYMLNRQLMQQPINVNVNSYPHPYNPYNYTVPIR
ncbi:MAG: hypothetical protein WCK17_01875 [Verrucomicrobiota bacterium]